MGARAARDTGGFVGRGGLKLRHALDAFAIDPAGLRCVDFGANVGGFTDCLLRAGAAHVTSIDTSYGTLAYTLRTDERVRVLERTNALHAAPPEGERFDLAVIDMGWTAQRLCVPAALAWLGSAGRIVSLVKPHYEAKGLAMEDRLERGVLSEADALAVLAGVLDALPTLGVRTLAVARSPIAGGRTRGRRSGNTEFLALLEPA